MRKTVYKIFKSLEGKEVFVHQYIPKNKETGEPFAHPNINYLFGNDVETANEVDNEDEDDDLPF